MCSDAAGLARSRTRTYEKDGKRKRAFFDEGSDALRAVLWAVGPALVLVFLREKFEEKKMHGNLPGKTT